MLLAAVVAFTSPALVPQDMQRKKLGTVFKDQVDALINALADGRRADGSLADGSAWLTAQVLCAMGHCHRGYCLAADGPVVREPLNFLFSRRRADGSFADPGAEQRSAELTALVADALEVLAPDEHREEIGRARRIAERDGAVGPWARAVTAARAASGAGGPLEWGAAAARSAGRGLVVGADGAPDHAASAAALVRLVACQVAARELDRAASGPQDTPAAFSAAQQRGLGWLLTQQEDGVFMVDVPEVGKVPDPGLTGLAIAALQTKPASRRSPEEQAVIDAGLRFLLSQQNDDGSFGQQVVNYVTCAVVYALAKSGNEEFAPALAKAQHYILGIQNVEDRGYARGDRDYGSIGYGGDRRGDLSNLQFAIEALRKTELQSGHEAFAKALVFLQRTQNLRSVNDFKAKVRDEESGEWMQVTSGDDGGSAYYPGNSPAGYVELGDGTRVPRSYGSMTYALLKTYTLCGVEADDPRVRAAFAWLEKNWVLDHNPGASPLLPEKAKYQGLYYYYMVMAQALDAIGAEELDTPAGKVAWRAALRGHLESLQSADGSWLNDRNGRWWENMPAICTVYALLALEHCQPR